MTRQTPCTFSPFCYASHSSLSQESVNHPRVHGAKSRSLIYVQTGPQTSSKGREAREAQGQDAETPQEEARQQLITAEELGLLLTARFQVRHQGYV